MDIPINRKIEQFLRETGMPPTVFGRWALRDPRFVFDLRMGREPSARVRCKAEHFMNIWRQNGNARYIARPRGRPYVARQKIAPIIRGWESCFSRV